MGLFRRAGGSLIENGRNGIRKVNLQRNTMTFFMTPSRREMIKTGSCQNESLAFANYSPQLKRPDICGQTSDVFPSEVNSKDLSYFFSSAACGIAKGPWGLPKKSEHDKLLAPSRYDAAHIDHFIGHRPIFLGFYLAGNLFLSGGHVFVKMIPPKQEHIVVNFFADGYWLFSFFFEFDAPVKNLAIPSAPYPNLSRVSSQYVQHVAFVLSKNP